MAQHHRTEGEVMSNYVNTALEWLADKLRASALLLITLVLLLVVAKVAPQQLGIVAYKGALLSGGGFLGYWVDRVLFPYGRPDQAEYQTQAHAEYRRAIVVAAALLAVGLSA